MQLSLNYLCMVPLFLQGTYASIAGSMKEHRTRPATYNYLQSRHSSKWNISLYWTLLFVSYLIASFTVIWSLITTAPQHEHSTKLPGTSSCVVWAQSNKPVFREPTLSSSTLNLTPRNSSLAYLYTRPNPWHVVGGKTHECLWEKSSARYAWFCFMFSLLFTGSQFRRKAKTPSLSHFVFRLLITAPFARCPHILMLWNRCDDLPWCYFLAIAEFSGWSAQRGFWCSLHLA